MILYLAVLIKTGILPVFVLFFSSGSKTPLQSFLGIAEQHTAHNGVTEPVRRTFFPTHTTSYILSRTLTATSARVCVPDRATCPSVPVLTTPRPSQPRNTSTRSSTWTAGTLDAPSSSQAKCRGLVKAEQHQISFIIFIIISLHCLFFKICLIFQV